jgi:hypothetical protein
VSASEEKWHVRFLPNMFKQRSPRRNGLICACIVAACVLLTYPVAEMGFQDDWSYVRTALEFARTGHFIYNGWATAMLGWIIPWSAQFIKAFGFSFTVVRLSMLPVTMACIYLFHANLVRFGIRDRNAMLGALTLGLSPIFLPMAASYMTDVAGLFVIVLCLYLCQRAVAAHSDRAAVLWMCCAAASNVAGGTVRQISWLGALVMVPSTAWLLRRRRGVVATGISLWVMSILGVLACLHWWNRQPYSVPEHILQGPVTAHMVHHLVGILIKSFLCLLLLLYPLLVAWVPAAGRLNRAAAIRVGVAVLVLTAFLWTVKTPDDWLAPWLTHVIQSLMRKSGEFPGVTETPWPLPVRVAISVLVLATALIVGEVLLSRFRSRSRSTSGLEPVIRQDFLWLLGPFSLSYIVMLLPRGIYALVYDRYLLGLMPLATIFLIRLYQRVVEDDLPAICFLMLGVFGFFSIAGTHDWFALNRARIVAVEEIHATGVPKTAIQGAFEYDGWTQIEAAGYINEERIEVPAGAFRKNMRMYRLPEKCWHFFGWYALAIDPIYVIVSSPSRCFADSTFSPVTFRAWLPPFHRTIYVQRMKSNSH